MLSEFRKSLRRFNFPTEDVLNVFKDMKGLNILDVGAGTGFFLELLDKRGVIIKGYGVEVNPAYFRKINERLEISGAVPEDEKFDLICFNDVLHHVKGTSKEDFIGKYLKHLKPQGLVFIKEMNPQHTLYRNFNRFHDLVMARELIDEVSPEEIELIMNDHFTNVLHGRKRVFLYDHYFYLFKAN